MEAPEEPGRRRTAAVLTRSGGILRTRSALNPFLWFAASVAVPLTAAVATTPSPPVILSICLGTVIFAATFGFLWLLTRDPMRLHSEDYLLRSRTLELMEQKGTRKAIEGAAAEILGRPEFLSFPEDRKRGES